MLEFKPFSQENKDLFNTFLMHCGEQGCEYSFTNLFLWGRQRATVYENHLVFFSQFNRQSVYLYPIGNGDKKKVLDAIIHDAAQRDIPCRLTSLLQADCEELERLYPGKFRIHCDRDGFDYIYDIHDLADLKGKKFQKKRNHLNQFFLKNEDVSFAPITPENIPEVQEFLASWYAQRAELDPHGDFHMEKAALKKALENWQWLCMTGLVLKKGDEIIAMTAGSFLSEECFDVHFEKATDRVQGAYAAINQGFAQYLRTQYPNLRWLNREDDLGLEGLRKAKLSYYPDHLIEKHWACLLEDGYEY